MSEPQLARPVLVIEADATVRERLYDALTRYGLTIIAVGSAHHAIETLKHERPGAVVVNSRLADCETTELIEQLRSVDATLPIFVLEDPSHPLHLNGHASMTPQPVLLPRTIQDEALAHRLHASLTAASTGAAPHWPGTILVVDDEPRLRAILCDFLKIQGFTAIMAGTGEEALASFERTRPSIVLLDVCMPGMDGLLTLKKMKALRSDVTVIMITGLEEEQNVAQAQALGADDYISKPFNLDYLQTVLLSKLLLDRTSS